MKDNSLELSVELENRLRSVKLRLPDHPTLEILIPCLVFESSRQMRLLLASDDRIRSLDAALLSYVDKGGLTTDQVALLLGNFPSASRFVFLPTLQSLEECARCTSSREEWKSAVAEASMIRWKARFAREKLLDRLPEPGEHAPSA